MNSKIFTSFFLINIDFFVDFGIDTRHIKFPLITQQESHITSCNRNFKLTFVLNRVRVWGAGPHLPTQGYIEYPTHPSGEFADGWLFIWK